MDSIEANSANIKKITADTLSVAASLSSTGIVLNDGKDTINIGSAEGQTAGSDSVILGGGNTGAGDNTISIGQNNTITADGDFSIVIGFGSTSDEQNNIVMGYGNTYGNSYSILIGFGTYAQSNSDNSVVIGRSAYTSGERTVVLGYSSFTKQDDSVALGFDVASDGLSSIGIGNTATVTGDQAIAIGPSTNVSGDNSVAIGNGVVSRQNDEFATRGMRIIRLTATTTDDTPTTPQVVFSLFNDGDIASIDGAVTAMRTDAIPLGSEGTSWKFENYQIRREAGTGLVIFDGSEFQNDPHSKGYSVTFSNSGDDLEVSVTGALAEEVSWVLVFRVWCAPIA